METTHMTTTTTTTTNTTTATDTQTAQTTTTQATPNTIKRPLHRYSPPWKPLSPRAEFWYGKLERLTEAGLWLFRAVTRGKIADDYFISDVTDALWVWPESLDHKHFGQWREEGSETRFIKIGRLVVLVTPVAKE